MGMRVRKLQQKEKEQWTQARLVIESYTKGLETHVIADHSRVLREVRQFWNEELEKIDLEDCSEQLWLVVYQANIYLAECYIRLQQKTLGFQFIKRLRSQIKRRLKTIEEVGQKVKQDDIVRSFDSYMLKARATIQLEADEGNTTRQLMKAYRVKNSFKLESLVEVRLTFKWLQAMADMNLRSRNMI